MDGNDNGRNHYYYFSRTASSVSGLYDIHKDFKDWAISLKFKLKVNNFYGAFIVRFIGFIEIKAKIEPHTSTWYFIAQN